MRSFANAMAAAFSRHPDTSLQIRYDMESFESYVLATKAYQIGELVIVPCGPAVRTRTIKFGEHLAFIETKMCELENGDIVVCSPLDKRLTESTVRSSELDVGIYAGQGCPPPKKMMPPLPLPKTMISPEQRLTFLLKSHHENYWLFVNVITFSENYHIPRTFHHCTAGSGVQRDVIESSDRIANRVVRRIG